MLKELIEKFKVYGTHVETELLERAFHFSQKAHQEQRRASGEEYFSHCEAVADILVDHKLDLPTIAAGLLHDVLEDTPTTREALKGRFGEEIVVLVEGVTKLRKLKFTSHDQMEAENWRKMFLATAKDIRVILIKLADRLHNMRTLKFIDRQKQVMVAEETLNLYAPLGQRLGMFELKSELEDLAFETLHPDVYRDLKGRVERQIKSLTGALGSFQGNLENHLRGSGMPYRILTRAKNLYSLYGKMERQGKPLEEIQDHLGLRLVTDTVANCYGLLGIVHSSFKPVPDTFTDYLAHPKINLYQSLHTTVFSPEGELVEIQIRTEEMHRASEYGIAAHWKYKGSGSGKDSHFEEKVNWLRQWIEWLQDLKSPREFLESLRTDLQINRVFVFTPKGDVKELPEGATPLDFAYLVHTEIGHKCIGAHVNKKMVKLDYAFKSGDSCEIITRKGSGPKKDWLSLVKTAGARAKIRRYLREKGTAA